MLYQPFPGNDYKVIYADPPWSYNDKAAAGNRGASFKYPTIHLKDLYNLPVGSIASANCALFMWATAPLLPDAFKLIEAWGFAYKTVAFTWVKKNKVADSYFWGMGNYTRANAEYVLLGIKGKPKRVAANVHSVVDSKIRRHSHKPDEVRDRIVDLMGNVKRIELFARDRYEGWDVWGNEV